MSWSARARTSFTAKRSWSTWPPGMRASNRAAAMAAPAPARAGPGRVRALIQPGKGQNGGPTNFMTLGPGRTDTDELTRRAHHRCGKSAKLQLSGIRPAFVRRDFRDRRDRPIFIFSPWRTVCAPGAAVWRWRQTVSKAIGLETMGGAISNIYLDIASLPRRRKKRAARLRRSPSPVPIPAAGRRQRRRGRSASRTPQNRADPKRTAHRLARPRRRSDGNGAAPIERKGLLAVHAVEKSFVGRKVVKGVSLYVRKGEAVGLLGPNGAGKTTVFYMITGLIKADQGRIELDGCDVTRLADVPAGAARHRLSAARSLDFPRAHGRGQYPRRARSGRARSRGGASRTSMRCSKNSTSRACARRRRSRFPAASAAASRSPARWRRGRITCCSTNRSPASIRSPSATSRRWCGT